MSVHSMTSPHQPQDLPVRNAGATSRRATPLARSSGQARAVCDVARRWWCRHLPFLPKHASIRESQSALSVPIRAGHLEVPELMSAFGFKMRKLTRANVVGDRRADLPDRQRRARAFFLAARFRVGSIAPLSELFCSDTAWSGRTVSLKPGGTLS